MPHLRELVKLHEDAPFALIGLNYGDQPDAYRKGLEDHGVTWISAFQGDEGLISRLYHVQGYPTYFLIDAGGKLVRTSHSSKDFDEPIRELLAKRADEGEEEREGEGGK